MQTMWTFSTKRFSIVWSIEPDYDCDFSFDETGETERNVNSGLWECFTSKVSVEFDGVEVSSDYLCGSIYEDPEKFRDHGSYFSDMVRQVVKEARQELRKPAPYIRPNAA